MKKVVLETATVTQTIHNGSTYTSITADPIEAMKAIGKLVGLYHSAEEERDRRVVVRGNGSASRSLVIEEDISYHGSPSWSRIATPLETDGKRIDEYLAFGEVLKCVQQRLEEDAK